MRVEAIQPLADPTGEVIPIAFRARNKRTWPACTTASVWGATNV